MLERTFTDPRIYELPDNRGRYQIFARFPDVEDLLYCNYSPAGLKITESPIVDMFDGSIDVMKWRYHYSIVDNPFYYIIHPVDFNLLIKYYEHLLPDIPAFDLTQYIDKLKRLRQRYPEVLVIDVAFLTENYSYDRHSAFGYFGILPSPRAWAYIEKSARSVATYLY